MRHFCQVYRCIVTCKSMVAASRLIERWSCYIIDLSLYSYICVFILYSVEFAKLLKCKIDFNYFFGRRWVKSDLFICLINKPEHCDDSYYSYDEPLTHLLIKILNNALYLLNIMALKSLEVVIVEFFLIVVATWEGQLIKLMHLVFIKYNLYLYWIHVFRYSPSAGLPRFRSICPRCHWRRNTALAQQFREWFRVRQDQKRENISGTNS